MKNFISLRDFSSSELSGLLDRADFLRSAWKELRMPHSLVNHRVGLWFYGNGFRNRMAFELGAKAMGAMVTYIPGELGVHEPLDDIGAYLANWLTLLIVRCKKHDDLVELSNHSTIPVINARTDKGHPCEVLGDLQYIRQVRGNLEGLKVAFVGEPTNLCMSWLEAACVLPIRVTQVCPEGYEINPEILEDFKRNCSGEIAVTNDLDKALDNVDLVYTDCWPHGRNKKDIDYIHSRFIRYQIMPKHLSKLGEKGIFLPCPPVTRGQEVSTEAMHSPQCKNYEAKDNLLHIQNAIMEFVSTDNS